MTDTARAELAAEYAMLQNEYETVDRRAFAAKFASVPALAAGIGIGADAYPALLLASVLAALCLWALEALGKLQQAAYDPRIDALEDFFAGRAATPPAPFQIKRGWSEAFSARKSRIASDAAKIMLRPAVWFPYLPIAAAGALVALLR